MSPRTVDKAQKREQILRAALNVFARQGVSNFKMTDIAERAAVGKGTLYEYFPSKDDLISGAFNLLLTDFESDLFEQIDQDTDPVVKIRHLVRASCSFFKDQRERLDVMFDLWANSIPHIGTKPLIRDMDQAYYKMIGWLEEIIRDGIDRDIFKSVDTRFTASMIIAVLDGLMYQAVLGLIELDPVKISEELSHTFLDGIMK
jgi:TetR/AcrR family fatty acid metabolism transcriptional regulator